MGPPIDDPVRSRWLILALLFACRASLGFQFQALGSVADTLVERLGFSYAEIGTLIGLFTLPGLVLALPAGWAGRFVSDRLLVVGGLLALALGGVVASQAQGFGLLALGRLVAGAGFVFATIYMTKMVTDWFAGRELATALGILVISWPFGIAMGQVGHVRLAQAFDWPAAFLAASVHCAIAAVFAFLLYRSPPAATTGDAARGVAPLPPGSRADRPAAATRPASAAATPTAASPAAATRGLPRDELILTLIAALVWSLFNAGYVVYLSFAPRVLVAGGYDAAGASSVISLASWVMMFSAAGGGMLADRTGRRDLIVYVCAAVGVASLLLLPFTGLAVVLTLVFGLIGAAPVGVIMSLTGEAMAPQRRAFGMGVFFSLFFVVVSVAPPLAGRLFDASGDPFMPVLFAAALFAGTALANAAFRLAQRMLARH